jgi:uncharacterized low-complexity protein
MSDKNTLLKPIAAAIGVAFVSSVAFSSTGFANQNPGGNPFAMTDLSSGYMLAGEEGHDGEEGKCGEGKCGEGKCGEDKAAEGKCGEGKCGEGKCGEDKAGEGKCGEGKCGEGKCGEDKAEAETETEGE